MPNCAKTHQTNKNTANVYHEECNEYKENQWNNAIVCTLISYLNSVVKITSNTAKIPAIFKWCYCHFVILRFSFLFSVHSASDCKHASTPGPRKDQETVMWNNVLISNNYLWYWYNNATPYFLLLNWTFYQLLLPLVTVHSKTFWFTITQFKLQLQHSPLSILSA